MERAGLLCVIKHFPGNAGTDPHYHPSIIRGSRTEVELLVSPFVTLINEGARALMISHSSVPVIDREISSLSPVIMEEWLRSGLGFQGIIISDDFSMAAARIPAEESPQLSTEEASILSLASGADMVIVWPMDIRRTHMAIVAALADGSLSRERLREAASRVIFEKLRMGLIEQD
jgi:beta-N-acetylhexosaminidase